MKKAEYIQVKDYIVEVIRTDRIKSATIKVEEGVVSVVVPYQLPEERIKRLLTDKTKWIKDKISLQSLAMPASIRKYISGEAFPYLGRNYRLKIKRGTYAPVKLVQGRLLLILPLRREETSNGA